MLWSFSRKQVQWIYPHNNKIHYSHAFFELFSKLSSKQPDPALSCPIDQVNSLQSPRWERKKKTEWNKTKRPWKRNKNLNRSAWNFSSTLLINAYVAAIVSRLPKTDLWGIGHTLIDSSHNSIQWDCIKLFDVIWYSSLVTDQTYCCIKQYYNAIRRGMAPAKAAHHVAHSCIKHFY